MAIAIAGSALLGSALLASAQSSEDVATEPTTVPPSLIIPEQTVPHTATTETTTTEPEPTTTTELPETTTTGPESTTTTELPETTTVPPDPCAGSTLKVRVQGEDGQAVSTLLGVDVTQGSTKLENIDGTWQPIHNKYQRYSLVVVVNGKNDPNGEREVCLGQLPTNAAVYTEAYPRTYDPGTDELKPGNAHYADAMVHRVYPAPGRTVSITLPRKCVSETANKGSTGTVTFEPIVDGVATVPTRAAAWSATPNGTGYGADDIAYNGKLDVKQLHLAGNQSYKLQVHTKTLTGREVVTVVNGGVPVLPCKDTKAKIVVNGRACTYAVSYEGGSKDIPCSPQYIG